MARRPDMEYGERLRERIKQRLTALGISDRQKFSVSVGLGSTFLSDLFNNPERTQHLSSLVKLAKGLNCTVAWLTGADETSVQTLPKMPFYAEAGAYRMFYESVEPVGEIPVAVHDRYPNAKRFAVLIRDDNMSGRRMPATAGMWALCIDAVDASLAIETGRVYLIHRRRGDLVEIALWQAMVFADRIEFSACTTDHARNERSKFIAPRDLRPDPQAEIFVAGLYYGATFTDD